MRKPESLLKHLRVAAALLMITGPAHAQQFVTDDAATVDHRACQLELWHGSASSWIIPACSPFRGLELGFGVGRTAHSDTRTSEYVLHAKYVLRSWSLPTASVSVAIVAGTGAERLAEANESGSTSYFLYLPLSIAAPGERLMLHLNAGIHHAREPHEHGDVIHEGSEQALTWAARVDVQPLRHTERVLFIGELFGEDRTRPAFQLGIRTFAVTDRVSVDVSWGGHTAAGMAGTGFTAGLTWTPRSF